MTSINFSSQLTLMSHQGIGIQYQLASVICHHGDKMSSGHYSTIYIDDSSDEVNWRHANDSNVINITEHELYEGFTQSIYILVYTRK